MLRTRPFGPSAKLTQCHDGSAHSFTVSSDNPFVFFAIHKGIEF